jgi:hypothetical protein
MLIGLHHAYLLAKRAWPSVISNHFPTAKRPAITTVPAKNAAANADPNTGSEIFSHASAFVSCLGRVFLSIVNHRSGHFLGLGKSIQHRHRLRHTNEM